MTRSRPQALYVNSVLALFGALALMACAGNQPAGENATEPEPELEAEGYEAEATQGTAGEESVAVEGSALTADSDSDKSDVLEAAVASEAEGDVGEHFDDPAPGDSPNLECVPPGFEEDDTALLDKSQVYIHQIVYGTSRWFDGLFGESNVECAGNISRGFVGAGLRWDERDGTKFRARFRARIALPALNQRAQLIVGRGDADRYIEGTDDKAVQTLPDRFNDFDEQDFLLGLGYSRADGRRRGWDLGVGVKFSTPLDPYVRARYHLKPLFSEHWLWRTTPQLFWQESRGFGISLTSTFDVAMTERWMLRSWTSLVEDEVSEGVEWVQQFTAYQDASDRSAFAYAIYAQGETDYEVQVRDYGVEIRYRRRILREWFFIELSTSLSYPREFIEEKRERNIGAGIEFEMQFGEWPNRN